MITESLLAKGLGTVAGTIIALVFHPPKTLAGFVRRTSVSLISGPVFAPLVHHQLGMENTDENWLAAAALAAFVSWWAAGILTAVFKKWLMDKASQESD